MNTGIINKEWRSISGFINYQIRNIGRVRNVNTGRVLKQSLDGKGYYIVDLYSNSKRTTRLIHRVVAQEFIVNPDNQKCVDHISHNIKDNCVSNLRWAKGENNMNRKKEENPTSSKYKGVSYHNNRNKWEPYIHYNNRRKHIGLYYTENEGARAYNEKAIEICGEKAYLNEISDEDT